MQEKIWWKDHDKTVKHEATEAKPTVESSEATADGKKTSRGAPARGVPPSTVKTPAPTRATGAQQSPHAARVPRVTELGHHQANQALKRLVIWAGAQPSCR